MKDPYLYEDVDVLKNLSNIKDYEKLRALEGNLTRFSMAIVYALDFSKFNTKTIQEIHKIIFGGLYKWAGDFRSIQIEKAEYILGGDTVRYAHPSNIKKELNILSKEIAKLKYEKDKKQRVIKLARITAALWQIHPFREGNTRAIMAFSMLFALHLGIELDYKLFEKHAGYVRNALVWASQGIYSKFEYLEKIYLNSAGIRFEGDLDETKSDNYTNINGHHISDYKEIPHKYVENED